MKDAAAIAATLRAAAVARALRASAGVIVGVPLCLVAPLIMGSIFWFAAWQLGLSGGYGWTTFFWGATAVFVPLLLGLEAKSSGEYFSGTVREHGRAADDGGVAEIVEWAAGAPGGLAAIAQNPRVVLAGFIEVFLIGPRMILGGVREVRSAIRFRGVSFARAAEMLVALGRFAGGVHPDRLLAAGEDRLAIAPVIVYLAYHQWAGLAARGDKVWLPTDVRKRLS